MTSIWKLLESFFLREAKTAADLKDDLFKYITRRYDENEADEVRNMLQRMNFRDFKHAVGLKYMDPKVDELVKGMMQAAVSSARDKNKKVGDGPDKERPSRSYDRIDPQMAAAKSASVDAMRQLRSKSDVRSPSHPSPSKGDGGHAVGTAGQNRPKVQPTVAAGIQPQSPGKYKSGLVGSQRQVDKVTKEKGDKAGDQLAKELGVPSTSDRTKVNPETGEKTISVWSSDRVLKFMDPDSGGAGGKSDSEKRSDAHLRARDASVGRIDPGRLDKIKQGIISRNAAAQPGKLGPSRAPSFDGERWKPHGRERDTVRARPDMTTGNFAYSKGAIDPKHTGQEVVGLNGKWVLPSVYAAARAHGLGGDGGDVDDDDELGPGWRKVPNDD